MEAVFEFEKVVVCPIATLNYPEASTLRTGTV
jgi:hypothetical protein